MSPRARTSRSSSSALHRRVHSRPGACGLWYYDWTCSASNAYGPTPITSFILLAPSLPLSISCFLRWKVFIARFRFHSPACVGGPGACQRYNIHRHPRSTTSSLRTRWRCILEDSGSSQRLHHIPYLSTFSQLLRLSLILPCLSCSLSFLFVSSVSIRPYKGSERLVCVLLVQHNLH